MQESRLEQAKRHVTNGRRIIAAQERRVATLAAQGRDTTEAESLLATYRKTQAIFENDLKEIEAETKGPRVFP